MKMTTIFLVLTLQCHLCGAELYVAPDGNDMNPGTKEQPFKTIQKAATVMQAGDRCLIRAGTYRETVVPANSGNEQASMHSG